jgi:hypothetical protein
VTVALLTGCRPGSAAVDGSKAGTAAVMTCAPDSLHPVVVPPVTGLWIGERSVPPMRVAAMVGPASPGEGARITRRVESVELRDGASPIRSSTDTASMKLELLPPFGRRAESAGVAGSQMTQPVAVYAITTLVLLASYEPCDPSVGEPRVRYLRRDDRGVVAADLMLRRESMETVGVRR